MFPQLDSIDCTVEVMVSPVKTSCSLLHDISFPLPAAATFIIEMILYPEDGGKGPFETLSIYEFIRRSTRGDHNINVSQIDKPKEAVPLCSLHGGTTVSVLPCAGWKCVILFLSGEWFNTIYRFLYVKVNNRRVGRLHNQISQGRV